MEPAVKVEPKIEEPSKIVESLETKYPYKSPRKKPTSAVLTVKTEAMSCLGITAQLDSTEQLGTMTILYFSALSTKIQSRLYKLVLKTRHDGSSSVAWIRFSY